MEFIRAVAETRTSVLNNIIPRSFVLFTRYFYTMTFILEDLKAYCLSLFPLKSSLLVSYWSKIRNEEDIYTYRYIYVYQREFSSKICWSRRLILPIPQMQVGCVTLSWTPPLKKTVREPIWDPAQKSRWKQDLPKYCPSILAITLSSSPGHPPTGAALLRQHTPAARYFPIFAAYRHIKPPME